LRRKHEIIIIVVVRDVSQHVYKLELCCKSFSRKCTWVKC